MGDTFWWAAMIALFVVAGLALFAFCRPAVAQGLAGGAGEDIGRYLAATETTALRASCVTQGVIWVRFVQTTQPV
jgi:hypothetical protein